MKKYFSKLTLAIVAAVVLSLGVAIPAMAAETPPVALVPVEVGLTKVIDTPAGTTVPAMAFTFTFEQLRRNVDDTTAIVGPPAVPPQSAFVPGVPAGTTAAPIENRVASFPANMSGAQLTWQAHTPAPSNSPNILADVTFPHAGQFVYLVRETPVVNPALGDNMTMVFDTITYLLIVTVDNCPVANAPVAVSATAGRAVIIQPSQPGHPGTPDIDEIITLSPDGKLTNITPGIPGDPAIPGEDERVLVDPSQMVFTNVFTRTIVGTLENPALEVSKYVTGPQANLTLPFNFTIVLTIPEQVMNQNTPPSWAFPTVTPPGLPSVTTVAVPGTAITPVPPGIAGVTGAGAGDGPTFTVTVSLTHGQRIAFPVLPEGTTWSVLETGTPRYVPSAAVNVGGTPVTGSPFSATMGENLRVPAADATPNTFQIRGVGDAAAAGGNVAAFTNTHVPIDDTGLVIASMPVLAVLLGATVLLAMMVASRSRQRIEQLPIA